VIITTGRIRRTLVNKINLLVDSPRSIEASRLSLVKEESIFLRYTSSCFGTSSGSSSTTSTTSCVRVPRHVARLVYSSSTTSPPPRVRVPWHAARLVTRLVAPPVIDYSASRRLVVDNSASCRLVVDYFASAARPGASARRVARHATRRAARRRLLRLAPPVVDYTASRRLVIDNSASCRLVVDYFASGAGPSASACRAARRAARCRLLRVAQARRRLLHVARLFTCLVAPLVVDYSTSRRLVIDYSASHRLVVDNSASHRLVVDYFASAVRPGASARRVARHTARRATRRRLLRVAQARRRLLHLA
jgi:hypothetical protein